MKTSIRNAWLIVGGTALAVAAFLSRGAVPEILRYMRIRRM
jgi:hypothetical protein